MTARRAAGFDLGRAIQDPGFTPRAGDVGALLDRIAGGDELAEGAILRFGAAAGREAVERARGAEPVGRARITRLVGRLAGEAGGDALAGFLLETLGDADERTRRAAATALGKVRPAGAEQALAAALAAEKAPAARRALVEALGKVGGEGAIAALQGAGTGAPEAKARLIAARTLGRAVPSAIDAAVRAAGPTPVAVRCRAGLERFLIDELGTALAPRFVHRELGGPRVEATLTGSLEELLRARTMLSFGFPLAEVRLAREEDLPGAVAAALASKPALAIFRRWTRGPVRFRLGWAEGGKKRAAVWQIAAEAAERAAAAGAELVNDPTASLWDATVYRKGSAVRIELSPRAPDPRFAYRRGDVPAASHPTIAAALVRAGGVRPDDVVWDPFVGSGTELCERAIAGPYRLLVGSDRDPAALAVARENLAAAGAREPLLIEGDATSLALPARPTLIVTNPPLGRRVERSRALAPMLERFLAHAARTLAPGGRLAWISPFAESSEEAAVRAGLEPALAMDVDLGGFTAQLQVFSKRG